MSHEVRVQTDLQLICNLGNVGYSRICKTKILRFNFFCQTRWKVTVTDVVRITLLESDYDYLRVYFEVESNCPCKFEMGPREYSNFYEGDSKEYKNPNNNIMKCSHHFVSNDFPFKLVIHLDHNYVNYKRIKTLQSDNSKFSQQLQFLLQNTDMSDALLVVGNEEFPVHKVLLAAQSPVFYAMFNNDMKEKKENRVKIDDVDPEIMKQLLLYVYTGDIDADSVNNDQAVNLLKAADKYALEELKFICSKIISKNLTIDNVFAMIGMAEQYKHNYLKKEAAYFILRNFNHILKSMDDLNLIKPLFYEEKSVTETQKKT